MTMREYSESKAAFFRKHYGERGYRESGEVVGERICKSYIFEDGAEWFEITEPVYETTVVELHGIKNKVQLKFYRTEIWDTEDSKSRYLYEAA